MGKYSQILSKSDPTSGTAEVCLDLLPLAQTALAERPPTRSEHAHLAARLFAAPSAIRTVGFVSLRPGEGVTHSVRCIAEGAAHLGKRVIALDRFLEPLSFPGAETVPNREVRFDGVVSLRTQFDAILLDCGSLGVMYDALCHAPALDGIVLIVEAGKTKRDEILRAADLIQGAGGRLLGTVLNKRRYPIPSWLYRML